MLFRNEESSLRLDIVNYGFPPDGGDPTSDDRNWLVLRDDIQELRVVNRLSGKSRCIKKSPSPASKRG